MKDNVYGGGQHAAAADDASIDSFEELENEHSVNRKNRRTDDNPKYVNCDFIFGSCAEVERLWSIAKFILTSERKGNMSPFLFEAIVFLKMNQRLWDLSDVVSADHSRQAQN